MVLPRTVVGRVIGPRAVLRDLATEVVTTTGGRARARSTVRTAGTRVLLKVLHVVRSMPALQEGIGGRTLLLAFPQKVSAQGLGQLGRKHVAASGARRMGHRLWWRRLHDDWLGSGNIRTTHSEVFIVVLGRRGGNGRPVG